MVIRNRSYIPWGLCIALVLSLITSECRRRDDKQLADANLSASFDSINHYKNRLGTQTGTVKTLELDKKSLQDNIIEKNGELAKLAKEFASLKSVVKFRDVTRFDTIYMPFKKQIPFEFKRTDSINAKHYSFSYKVDSTGVVLQNFAIPNETTVLTGYKRKWFLGKQTLTTDITNSNPYISTQSIISAEVVIREPWYKKWYLWLTVGLVTGALLK